MGRVGHEMKTWGRDLAIYAVLAIATLVVYAQTAGFDFVNYDDPDYVSHNLTVRQGVTAEGASWAFGGHASNWIPLTWISHMADVEAFGLRGGMHHLTSVFFHVCSVLLLFAALRRMTKAVWPSAFVALMFGVHPLHVESVAWIAERKDVLSAFFWIATLWNYARYVERPRASRYMAVVVTFCLGLLAKPMTVTLPFILLLLDFWPLRRTETTKRLVGEKAPLMALSVVACVITFVVQRAGGAVIPLDGIPFGERVGNAFLSYATYLGQFFVPVRLAAFYPYPEALPVVEVATAALAVIGISVAAWRYRERWPWLFSGWFWYLGTLIPVIGLVQVGTQAHADRYTYIPLIGISIVVAWGVAAVVERRPQMRMGVAAAAGLGAVGCVVAASVQASYWKDSATLFRHAISVTDGNYEAWSGLGLAAEDAGDLREAAADFRRAIEIRPQFVDAQNNLGDVLLKTGHPEEAAVHLEEALRLQPGLAEGHANLGAALARMGKPAAAQDQYREALSLEPGSGAAHTGLAAALEDQGRKNEAMGELNEAIRVDPDYGPAHYNLGRLLGSAGRTEEAASQFAEAVRLEPRDAANHYNLGIALGTMGKLGEATAEFRTAVELDPSNAFAHFNLGSALAQQGDMSAAMGEFSEALRLKPDFSEARQNLETAKAIQAGK